MLCCNTQRLLVHISYHVLNAIRIIFHSLWSSLKNFEILNEILRYVGWKVNDTSICKWLERSGYLHPLIHAVDFILVKFGTYAYVMHPSIEMQTWELLTGVNMQNIECKNGCAWMKWKMKHKNRYEFKVKKL